MLAPSPFIRVRAMANIILIIILNRNEDWIVLHLHGATMSYLPTKHSSLFLFQAMALWEDTGDGHDPYD